MCKKTEKRIVGSRTTNTFMHLKKASCLLLKEAEENPDGSYYKYMTSMLNSAFCLEAYLNHLGKNFFKDKKLLIWEICEKKLRTQEKLKILAHAIDYQIDNSRRPFQTFQKIFKFRNSLVHGKTEETIVNKVQKVNAEEPRDKQLPKPEWENMINKETAERFFEDATKMIEILHAQAGLPEIDLSTLGKFSATSAPVRHT